MKLVGVFAQSKKLKRKLGIQKRKRGAVHFRRKTYQRFSNESYSIYLARQELSLKNTKTSKEETKP